MSNTTNQIYVRTPCFLYLFFLSKQQEEEVQRIKQAHQEMRGQGTEEGEGRGEGPELHLAGSPYCCR